jgi:hypothetical protein
VALLITQIGTLLATGRPAAGALPAVIIAAGVAVVVGMLMRRQPANPALTTSPAQAAKGD